MSDLRFPDPVLGLQPYCDAVRLVITNSASPIWSPGSLGVQLRAAAARHSSVWLTNTITDMQLRFTVETGWRSPISDAALTELLVLGDVTVSKDGYRAVAA